MLPSVDFHKFSFGVLGLALVFVPVLGAFPAPPDSQPGTSPASALKSMAKPATAPPSAPPVIQDSVLPNLFYGATPLTTATPPGPCASVTTCPTPVLVFVHGLGGTYADWLEVNNCPTTPAGIPCNTTGHGASAGNDMYDYAYEAGFRTAFMSMNANNSNNSASIQTNAAMLETIFPRILATFGVSQVYFICHSKGGLDLQGALASIPQPPANPPVYWDSIAKAVITLGTPNQGDALADWIFGTSNGQSIGSFLGLLTPGVQALQSSNVEQFRAQWDPIFDNAQIPFYSVAGDVCTPSTYLVTGSACADTGSGPILSTITGGASSPDNDMLVTQPETYLPYNYSMIMGVELENHYQLRLGDYSFSLIYARVMAQENQQNGAQPGLTRVATNGFGDEHNTEAWSMAWFNNQLYVGTGREVYCVTYADAAAQSGLYGLYPPPLGDCSITPYTESGTPPKPSPGFTNGVFTATLPLQAEIWQYTPSTNTWVRVFQSPNTVGIPGTTGGTCGGELCTSIEMGIRSLTVVTEPSPGCGQTGSPTQALYAGTVTSGAVYEPNHTVGGWAPPRILRSVDGINWAPLPQAAGTFLGDISQPSAAGASQSFQVFGIRSGGQLNGVLYLQIGDYSGVGQVIANIPGTNPACGGNNFQYVSPPANEMPVWILQNFNGFMYAGTGNPYSAPGAPTQYGVWYTSGYPTQTTAPYTWNPVIDNNGAFATGGLVSNYVLSLQIFSDPVGCPPQNGTVAGGAGGCLYVGTDQPSEMIRIHPDTTGLVQVDATDSWDLVVGNPRIIPSGPQADDLVAPISGIGQYFDNGFTGHFWRMGVGGLGLYMSTWDSSGESSYQNGFAQNWAQEFGTDLYLTNDGIHWTAVSKIALGDGMNTGGRTFQETPYGLYWGTARPEGGTQIFMIDNSVLDANKDGVIDQKDVDLVTARLNTKARPKDPMDLNEDGVIDQKDVELLKTQCTYPKCAVRVRPAQSTAGSPVVDSAPGALGSTVTLTWPAVANAVDYLVYRIDMSSSETTPPPGFGPAELKSACATNKGLAVLPVCFSARATPHQTQSTPYGYPGAPIFVTRVTTPTFSETPPSTLQLLYFVRSEDEFGNLSAPSNLAPGPSLAAAP